MNATELEKLKAVLPAFMKIKEHVGALIVVDEHLNETHSIEFEPTAQGAVSYLLGCYATAGRKEAKREQEKQLRDLLGLTHSLNDIHSRIGALNTRLIQVEEMHVIGETPDAAAPSASRSRSSGGTGSQEPRPEKAPETESN